MAGRCSRRTRPAGVSGVKHPFGNLDCVAADARAGHPAVFDVDLQPDTGRAAHLHALLDPVTRGAVYLAVEMGIAPAKAAAAEPVAGSS